MTREEAIQKVRKLSSNKWTERDIADHVDILACLGLLKFEEPEPTTKQRQIEAILINCIYKVIPIEKAIKQLDNLCEFVSFDEVVSSPRPVPEYDLIRDTLFACKAFVKAHNTQTSYEFEIKQLKNCLAEW